MNSAEFLLWVRGPGLGIATVIFALGMSIRVVEIFMLGRKKNLAKLRSSGVAEGFKTIFTRSMMNDRNTLKRSLFVYVAGYTFHIGLFVAIFTFAPHIELIDEVLHLRWGSLPSTVVDFFTVIAMIALIAILFRRMTHPVLKFLSRREDYLVWTVTFLPLLTGYLSYHHLLLPYTWMLAVHILSVEILMVVFPFTKLTHTFTTFTSRFYNGSISGQKGVQS
ncbi:hypothetical protein BOW53_07475 [Solemya pervernicosa gill symbiont]|uniref:Nitrate reductase n=1 Tax=Solemya pervernicosa gill symbiont TaxID=642797 RepID=A0A1T2L5X5_9GAMM|nr:hypothetical protein [Solemya pervernicosa gill symbiont]OOZ40481.1 hypothetical protein BOW53_07475 [Solemya pervernicosa gill symbiont]